MKRIVALLTLFYLYQGKKIRWKDRGTGCPPDWIRFLDTDRCYYMSPRADTYENAMKDCASRNSDLAPPITCAEQYDLKEFLLAYRRNCRKEESCDEFWIGIHNLTGSGWKTPKGIDIRNITYSRCRYWALGYPKDDGRCVIMSYKENRKKGVWRNDICTKQLKYACIMCPNNFEYFPELNECLFFNATPTNWTEAGELCHEMKWGSYLLTIRNPRKHKIVEDYLKTVLARKGTEICFQKGPVGGNILWLGAQTENPNDCKTPYVWKTPLEPFKPFIHQNWFSGEPNCAQKGDNCAIIAPERNYKWEDTNCASQLCYVCEFP